MELKSEIHSKEQIQIQEPIDALIADVYTNLVLPKDSMS